MAKTSHLTRGRCRITITPENTGRHRVFWFVSGRPDPMAHEKRVAEGSSKTKTQARKAAIRAAKAGGCSGHKRKHR